MIFSLSKNLQEFFQERFFTRRILQEENSRTRRFKTLESCISQHPKHSKHSTPSEQTKPYCHTIPTILTNSLHHTNHTNHSIEFTFYRSQLYYNIKTMEHNNMRSFIVALAISAFLIACFIYGTSEDVWYAGTPTVQEQRWWLMASDNKSSVHYSGITFGGLLTIVFIALKLTNHIDWSWWWVLSPLWIEMALVFLTVVIVLIVLAVKQGGE